MKVCPSINLSKWEIFKFRTWKIVSKQKNCDELLFYILALKTGMSTFIENMKYSFPHLKKKYTGKSRQSLFILPKVNSIWNYLCVSACASGIDSSRR